MPASHTNAPLVRRCAAAIALLFAAGVDTASADQTPYLLDRFDNAAWTNQDGACNWTGGWREHDTRSLGASQGAARVANGELQMTAWGAYAQPSVRRSADLSGINSAQLSFDFRTSSKVDAGDQVAVEVFFAGHGYMLLDRFDVGAGNSHGTRSYDISGFTSSNTQVRIRLAAGFSGFDEVFYVDELRVTADQNTCRPPTAATVVDASGPSADADLPQLSKLAR